MTDTGVMAPVLVLAWIIQGEAGQMGAPGMCAVAMSMHTRMWEYGHDVERIKNEYYGWAEPGRDAMWFAAMVLDRKFPEGMDLYWAMGGRCDVEDRGWKNGDYYVVDNESGDSVHLYHYGNVPWVNEEDDKSDDGG